MIYVSSACVDITPDRPLELGGSWSRKGPLRSTGVDEAIEANLVLLESAETRVILLSIDALFAGPDLAADLTTRCARQGYPMQVHALATIRTGRRCWIGESRFSANATRLGIARSCAGLPARPGRLCNHVVPD